MDDFFQLAPPNLTGLGLGTATFESMQALGFSADGKLLLVKISFTDDGEPTLFSKYATFVYDLTEGQYIASLNDLLGPDASVTQVKDAYIVGVKASWEVIANVDVMNANSTILKSYSSTGEVVSNLLVAEATGLTHLTSSSEIEVESFQATDDGRYLAVQTSSDLLAVNASDDVNQSSDIYLLDRETGKVTRVSFQGGIGKDDAVYLADISKQGSKLNVAFVTDQYFSTYDKNSIEVDPNSSIDSRNDLYIASADLSVDGTVSEFNFELLSVDADGYATGFVDKDTDSSPKITDSGIYFSSEAVSLVSGDNNNSKDVFISSSNGIQRIELSGIDELLGGADFVGANKSGRSVYLKTSSEELGGTPGVDQIVKVSVTDFSYEVVSNNNVQADNIVINASVSPRGGSIAFTSLASNLVSVDQTLGIDYDLYVYTEFEGIEKYGTDGSDKFTSTSENEIYSGLAGADEFIFTKPQQGDFGYDDFAGFGDDTIIDFEAGVDTLSLTGYAAGDYRTTTDEFGNTVVAMTNEDTSIKLEAAEAATTLSYKQISSGDVVHYLGTSQVGTVDAGSGSGAKIDNFDSVKVSGIEDFLKTKLLASSTATKETSAVGLSDALAQLKHISGKEKYELKGAAFAAGDLDDDGKINLPDVLAILKHLSGKTKYAIDTFDVVTEHGLVVDSLSAGSKGELNLVIEGDADQSHANWDLGLA